MKAREKEIVQSVGKELDEFRHTLREQARNAAPYFAGGISAIMVAGLGVTAALRYGAKEDMVVNAVVVAIPIGARVFKDVQRDAEKMSELERISSRKLPNSEQDELSRFGTFDQKSALLNNPHINQKALHAISNDSEFIYELLRSLKSARDDLNRYEYSLVARPDNPYYRGIVREISGRIEAYEKNEHTLFGDSRRPKLRAVA